MTYVCILGAGWYGCHAARLLKRQNIDFRILDKTGIFTGASSKNQNRLHLGYHYPRSPETICECQEGYTKFLEEYGEHTVAFPNNYYLIHENSKSSVDDYRVLFSPDTHTEYDIQDIGMEVRQLCNTVFAVNERFIRHQSIESYMKQELLPYVDICESPTIEWSETKILVNGVAYDVVLNCTNNQYIPIPVLPSPTYETFCSFLYRIPFDFPIGLTVMDGPFFSIYPYDIENQVYTVTHVVYGVLGDPSARQTVESEIFKVFPELQSRMEYKGFFLSQKTKYDSVRDDRSLRWGSKGNYYSFSGGKITGIFEMEKVLKERGICS